MLTGLKRKINKLVESHKVHLSPSFLIIGGQKCGTTALFEYLSKHHHLLPASIKELDFFSCKSRYAKGIEFYHSHFPIVEKNTEGLQAFEASPDYLFNPAAPRRIFEYDHTLKLIAILRDPVERAFSAWNMYRKRYRYDREWFHNWMKRCDETYVSTSIVNRKIEEFDSFDSVVKEEMSAVERDAFIEAPILVHGMYGEQLERYTDLFDRKQLLILENKMLGTDTVGALRQIEQFLNISAHDWRGEDISPIFTGEYKDEMPADTANLLREFYRPHNERLFKLLGRTFDW